MPDIKSRRITLLSKEKYKVDLEYNEDFAILHLPTVAKFTKDVYLDMKFTIEDITEFLDAAGYPDVWLAISPYDKVLKKFVGRLGFGYKGTAEDMDVYIYEGVN